MNRTIIGLLFILCGVTYGSFVIDDIYDHTVGWLIANNWVKPAVITKATKVTPFGRKPTIVLYSLALIAIGIFILWNRNS